MPSDETPDFPRTWLDDPGLVRRRVRPSAQLPPVGANGSNVGATMDDLHAAGEQLMSALAAIIEGYNQLPQATRDAIEQLVRARDEARRQRDEALIQVIQSRGENARIRAQLPPMIVDGDTP